MTIPIVDRLTPGKNTQITTLQALRGISALLVLGLHSVPFAPHLFRYLFSWGFAGVDFFFVLSGFILLYVHYGQIGRPEKLRSYFIRRFSRIYPSYWAVMVFLIPAAFVLRSLVPPEKLHPGF